MHRSHPTRTARGRATLTLCALLLAGAAATVARAQAPEQVVATVNGRSITQGEVDASVAAELAPLEQQAYAIRKAALENLILRAVLEGEARRRGVTVEELRRRLTEVKVEIPPSQVEEAYLENASAFGAMNPDEAREKLRLDLESRARLRSYHEALLRLKENSSVVLLLAEPEAPLVAGNDAAPALGARHAAVTITEFSDFQCPYCKEAQGPLREILKAFGGEVRLVFRHLPLGIHRHAFAAAQGAFCAGEQGAFWPYHDALFASDSLAPEILGRAAARLGLNAAEFQSCLDSEASRMAVLRDMWEARRLGIDGTPTFLINGKLIRGAPGLDDLRGLVERELKAARQNPGSR